MTEPMDETYKIVIERRQTEFEVTEMTIPSDNFGKKMLAIMLYNLAEHIDPAFQRGENEAKAS